MLDFICQVSTAPLLSLYIISHQFTAGCKLVDHARHSLNSLGSWKRLSSAQSQIFLEISKRVFKLLCGKQEGRGGACEISRSLTPPTTNKSRWHKRRIFPPPDPACSWKWSPVRRLTMWRVLFFAWRQNLACAGFRGGGGAAGPARSQISPRIFVPSTKSSRYVLFKC